MRVATIAGHLVEQHSSPNHGPAMRRHLGVVLHIAQGTYRGTIAWQMNPDQHYADGTAVTTSSTWIVGREPGEVAQMVDSGVVAWCQRAGSYDWLSVELAGFAPAAPTDWQVQACAHLLTWAHEHYTVPLRVAAHPGDGGGLGHHSMDREKWLGEEWGHEACPGAGVINAKPGIVALAQRLATGEGMTPEEAQQAVVVGMSQLLAAAARRDTPTGRNAANWMYAIQRVADGFPVGDANTPGIPSLDARFTAIEGTLAEIQATPPGGLSDADKDWLRAEIRDAVADLGEGGASAVRADDQ